MTYFFIDRANLNSFMPMDKETLVTQKYDGRGLAYGLSKFVSTAQLKDSCFYVSVEANSLLQRFSGYLLLVTETNVGSKYAVL